MENRKLKIYNEDNSDINEEIISFCHQNFVIQNLKKELMREFSSICSDLEKLLNKINEIFENYFKNKVYSSIRFYRDNEDDHRNEISVSVICNMCMVCIVDNFKLIRTNLYSYCINQMYDK